MDLAQTARQALEDASPSVANEALTLIAVIRAQLKNGVRHLLCEADCGGCEPGGGCEPRGSLPPDPVGGGLRTGSGGSEPPTLLVDEQTILTALSSGKTLLLDTSCQVRRTSVSIELGKLHGRYCRSGGNARQTLH